MSTFATIRHHSIASPLVCFNCILIGVRLQDGEEHYSYGMESSRGE
eukprot:COSAG02_NODE_67821_length_252_cov_0.660131_2_plen_45_part_01